jgi:hypothetical protein
MNPAADKGTSSVETLRSSQDDKRGLVILNRVKSHQTGLVILSEAKSHQTGFVILSEAKNLIHLKAF